MFWKIPFLKKKLAYNRVTVNLISQKIRVSDMESCYKHISEIRNATFIFQNLPTNFLKRKKN